MVNEMIVDVEQVLRATLNRYAKRWKVGGKDSLLAKGPNAAVTD
jgi:hypothetical protein